MTFVGCDLHTRQQQVAVLDTTTGEIHEHHLPHDGTTVEDFYAALPRPVTVGIESTGYSIWFHALLQRLGHTVLVGDAAKIRAVVVRKTKTDRRDALHILDLLRHDRFPTIWLPDPATRELTLVQVMVVVAVPVVRFAVKFTFPFRSASNPKVPESAYGVPPILTVPLSIIQVGSMFVLSGMMLPEREPLEVMPRNCPVRLPLQDRPTVDP